MLCPILFLTSLGLCTVHGSNNKRPNYITEEEFLLVQSTPTTVPNGTQFNPPHNPTLPGASARNAWRHSQWPGARVPYILDPNFSDSERLVVAAAFNNYHRSTCVRFVPKQSSHIDFVNIQRDDSVCGSAQVCITGGEQWAKFGGSCITAGVMTHELGHTLCFSHEQSRSDRDQYISFDTGICEPQDIDSADNWTTLDLLYDYVSVQHYEGECYNGCINPKLPFVTKCGSGGGLSVLDVEKINAYYNCKGCFSYRFRPNSLLTSSDQAVVAGKDVEGQDLYICRAYVDGDIVPGKANLEWDECYLPYGFEEVKPDSYEVLTNPNNGANLQWIPKPTDGSFPSNAIPGGRSGEREPLYIGRCTVGTSYGTTTIPGKIHLSASSDMYYSFEGIEEQCSDYEILVCS